VTLSTLVVFTKQHLSSAKFSDKSCGERGRKGHSPYPSAFSVSGYLEESLALV